ncbi:MAG TPA: hypothetical protein VF209_03505 [Patescibacteria group bacterium]
MKYYLNAIILTSVTVLLALIVGKVYFHTGFPYTHDGENHLARFANYKTALKEGQIPPRFAPNLMNHYGYPVFNYNYPLANIISLPFSLLKINYEVTFKVIAVAFLIIGLLGVHRWLAMLNFSLLAQLFGMSVFATNPYLINVIYYRGNIGELIAICLLPWIFLIIEHVHKSNKSVFFHYRQTNLLTLCYTSIYAAFFLSHNLAVIFGMPLILAYAALRLKLNKEKWIYYFAILVSASLLTLWFWLPAITEKNQVILGSGKLTSNFLQHFPTISQLFFDAFSFGFSYPGKVDSLSFWLGGVQLLSLILASFYSIKNDWYWRALVILAWLLLFFQLSPTSPLWQLFSFARFIQFPWRLSMFFSLIIIPIGAFTWENSSKTLKALFLVLLAFQLISVVRLTPVDYFHKENVDYDAYPQSTSTLNENLPLGFMYINLGDWQPGPHILEGAGQVAVNYWTGSDRSYQLTLTQPSLIVEPTMKFLGWQTSSDAQTVQYVDNEDIDGRIAYRLEPGEYQIRTRFTQWTWARIVGNTVSLVALVGLVSLAGYQFVKKYQR